MATYGLRVWDENGNLTLDISDRITRILGEIPVSAGVGGSLYVPEFSQGVPFLFLDVDNGGYDFQLGRYIKKKNAEVVGNALGWDDGTGGTILYGVY